MQGREISTGPGAARRLLAAGMAVMIAATAPAAAQTGSDTEAQGAVSVSTEVELAPVDEYRLGLLKMRGHLSVARALFQLDAPGAGYHMADSLQRTFRSVEDALEERNAPVTEDMLTELENAAGLEPARALRALESAVQQINGSFAQTGAMDAASVLGLVEALLRAAVANYAEAVTDNEVTELRAYQTGRGFVTQAEALVRHSSALAGREGQDDLLKVVTLIRQSWPGVMPPPIVFDPATVAGRLDDAAALMQEMK